MAVKKVVMTDNVMVGKKADNMVASRVVK